MAFLKHTIPFGKKVAYAAPAFALAVVGIPVYVFIPKFYSYVVGVHIALLGYIILGVRIFDALTDPVIGYISDRTWTRFGRRRPYMAAGAVFLALTIVFLFYLDEMSHLANHSSNWRSVFLLHRLVEATQTQRPESPPLISLVSNSTLDPGNSHSQTIL